jgi:hypothetical protein
MCSQTNSSSLLIASPHFINSLKQRGRGWSFGHLRMVRLYLCQNPQLLAPSSKNEYSSLKEHQSDVAPAACAGWGVRFGVAYLPVRVGARR